MRRLFGSQYEYCLLVLPAIVFYILFCYIPMYGAIIAFKDLRFGDTIATAKWVGVKWFVEFFQNMYFWRLIKNTLLISIYSLIFGFPVPVIFALVLNEIRREKFKKVVQTTSYMPFFISTVVVVGILYNFVSYRTGLVNNILESLGHGRINFLIESRYFRLMYIGSGIWQGFGWNSIIYIAAITSLNPELYESAVIDGAKRLQQMWHITLPSIIPTIVIILIFSMGGLLSVGFEKIILMYNPNTYDVADVISTYVYRQGLVANDYSYGTAVGLFNSVAAFLLLIFANKISKRLTDIGLW